MRLEFAQAVPVVPLMGFPGARLTYTTIKQNHEDAGVQLESLKSLYDRHHPDALLTMMDLTVEAEALALKILKEEDASFTVLEHPVETETDVARLKMPDVARDGRIPLFVDVVKKMDAHFDCLKLLMLRDLIL